MSRVDVETEAHFLIRGDHVRAVVRGHIDDRNCIWVDEVEDECGRRLELSGQDEEAAYHSLMEAIWNPR